MEKINLLGQKRNQWFPGAGERAEWLTTKGQHEGTLEVIELFARHL